MTWTLSMSNGSSRSKVNSINRYEHWKWSTINYAWLTKTTTLELGTIPPLPINNNNNSNSSSSNNSWCSISSNRPQWWTPLRVRHRLFCRHITVNSRNHWFNRHPRPIRMVHRVNISKQQQQQTHPTAIYTQPYYVSLFFADQLLEFFFSWILAIDVSSPWPILHAVSIRWSSDGTSCSSIWKSSNEW